MTNLYILSSMLRKAGKGVPGSYGPVYEAFNSQSKYDLGYVLLSDQVMPNNLEFEIVHNISAIELCNRVKAVGVPTFLGAHIPIQC